jgi:hypothetical protein
MATILGVTPIAIALGSASTSRIPMGVAIIGGLLFSLLLTLYVIPSIFTFFNRDKKEDLSAQDDVLVVEPEPIDENIVAIEDSKEIPNLPDSESIVELAVAAEKEPVISKERDISSYQPMVPSALPEETNEEKEDDQSTGMIGESLEEIQGEQEDLGISLATESPKEESVSVDPAFGQWDLPTVEEEAILTPEEVAAELVASHPIAVIEPDLGEEPKQEKEKKVLKRKKDKKKKKQKRKKKAR